MAVIGGVGGVDRALGAIVDLVEGGPPFARNTRAVVVTDDVPGDEIEVSFLDQTSERFIGAADWSVDPTWHRATRTTLPDGRSGFTVGPEITRFLRLNVAYLIATRTGLSAEVVSKVTTLQTARPDAGIGFDADGRPLASRERTLPQPSPTLTLPPPPPAPVVAPPIPLPLAPSVGQRRPRPLFWLLVILAALAAYYLVTHCVIRIAAFPSSWQNCPLPLPPPPPPPPPPQPRGCQEQGCETGRLQITLIWPTQDDLDLYVDCPGDTLNFSHRSGSCGDGKLDIDAQNERDMPNPVENVRWQAPPPNGRYRVRVQLWDFRGRPRPIDYEVQIRLNDQLRSCKGRITTPKEAGEQTVISFTLPAAAAPGGVPACTRPQ